MISVGDAVVKLGLDKTQFNEGMRSAGDETNVAGKKMQDGMRIAAIAITAVGVAALVVVDKARKMNAELKQVSITTGIMSGDLRDLALDLSNVTFRLNSVIATLVLLSRTGVKNKEDLKAHANAFDALGDAIGSTAEEVAAQLIPAFGIFGLQLPKTMEDTDKLTWLVKNTLIDMSDFASVMEYVAMYGAELNVTLDDMIAIMFELNKRNVTGAAATRLFRTAVSQAAREGISLNDALNISRETMDEWITKISVDAVGATEAFSEAANTQFGIMDKLKAAWDDLTFSVGSFLTPLEPVFALMTALGPIMLAMSLTTLPGLIANLKASAIALGGYAVAAAKAVAGNVALAASKIWAWASAIPVAGIAIAIAGVAALIASIAIVKSRAAAAVAELAEGGIVTRPTRALIGEAGPEAVIPLSQAGLTGTKEVHIHVGNYMGDEMSMRQLVRKIDQMLKEEGRRSAFGQVNQGWYYGRSSL